MKLEHIQNELKNHVGDFVRTEAKEATVLWMHEKGLPAAREVSAAYTAALKESAEKETGWCRFRDRIFLPLVIEGAVWMTGKMLDGGKPLRGNANRERLNLRCPLRFYPRKNCPKCKAPAPVKQTAKRHHFTE